MRLHATLRLIILALTVCFLQTAYADQDNKIVIHSVRSLENMPSKPEKAIGELLVEFEYSYDGTLGDLNGRAIAASGIDLEISSAGKLADRLQVGSHKTVRLKVFRPWIAEETLTKHIVFRAYPVTSNFVHVFQKLLEYTSSIGLIYYASATSRQL